MKNPFHVIKDPVHGTMQFTSTEDAWVKPFMDSPNFQRLRHIKQLGLGDFIFPGAVHTRFNHCLGSCYVASQIAHKIGLVDEERQLVMIAALLHDIGHGPFSHAFEGIFKDKLIRHEDWTPYFLADYGTQAFFSHYNRLNPRYHLTEEKFREIAKMIMHQPVEKQVLADVVSSQLDADRLDYLLRDSHFCGVRYGEFDFHWMLHCMAIVQSHQGERLGITYKGVGAVEHYLMARRLMTRNIYHLQKKLGLEALLVEWLVALAKSLAHYQPYTAIKATQLGQFLIAAEAFNAEIVSAKDPHHTKKQFLETYYQHYKALCDYDIFALIRQLAELDDDAPATQMAKRLQSREMPATRRLNFSDIALIRNKVDAFKSQHKNAFQDWQMLLIETPHQSYSDEDDPILMITEQGDVQSITHSSLMINAISDRLEHVVFLCVDAAMMSDRRVIDFIQTLER